MNKDHDHARQAGAAVIERAGEAWQGRERDRRAAEHLEQLDRLDRVARDAPQVRTAAALSDQHLLDPVPIDAQLEPTGGPLTDRAAILAHWTAHPADGIGLPTGQHPHRPVTYVAVKVSTFGQWGDWLHAAASVTEKLPDLGGFADLGGMPEMGPPQDSTTVRNPGAFTRLAWVPPPLPSLTRYRMDGQGTQLLEERLREQRVGRGGWVWLAVHDPDRRIVVKRPRPMVDGVTVVPDGTVIPWENTANADGWTIRLTVPAHTHGGLSPSKSDPPAGWLLEELTGTTL